MSRCMTFRISGTVGFVCHATRSPFTEQEQVICEVLVPMPRILYGKISRLDAFDVSKYQRDVAAAILHCQLLIRLLFSSPKFQRIMDSNSTAWNWGTQPGQQQLFLLSST